MTKHKYYENVRLRHINGGVKLYLPNINTLHHQTVMFNFNFLIKRTCRTRMLNRN